jgi:hypothetical protein
MLEKGDGVMANGFTAAAISEVGEDCVIVTLTAGPGRARNDVEIYVPKSLIGRFREIIANAEGNAIL